jgi:hypothetical protein
MEEAIDTIVERLLAAKKREAKAKEGEAKRRVDKDCIAATIELIRQAPHANDPGHAVANRLADAVVEASGKTMSTSAYFVFQMTCGRSAGFWESFQQH